MIPVGIVEGIAHASYVDFSHIYTVAQERLERKVGELHTTRWTEVKHALSEIFYRTLSS